MAQLDIKPENSAQGKNSPPNPFVETSVAYLLAGPLRGSDVSKLRVADQGCGNLRHLAKLQRRFTTLFLIDTPAQINRVHIIGKGRTTLADYVKDLKSRGKTYTLLDNFQFEKARLKLDIILCVCVFDVVPSRVRRRLIKAAASNLRRGGYYCVIVPRNDQTITSRCTPANAYEDGHVFQRGMGSWTFYANFSNRSPPLCTLRKNLAEAGFRTVADLSVHRQICLIMTNA